MNEIQQFEQLVSRRAGISLREQERATLTNLLQSRLNHLGMARLENYFALLESGSVAGEAEWTQMFALLTNNETYFFRDIGQLNLLRDQIFPEIIEANRARRTLRIWSAGCSTGEEPYSLAMILEEILGLENGWKILILGTDLSAAALEKARRGVYGTWSFRAMNEERRQRFFMPAERRSNGVDARSFCLQPRIANAVTFKQNNLWRDAFPSVASDLHHMDLIVCRNVFIYFARPAVAAVLGKFRQTLRPGGYLLTGHAELHDTHLHGLEICTFPQTVIYQAPNSTPSRSISTTLATPVAREIPRSSIVAPPVVASKVAAPRALSPMVSASQTTAARGENRVFVDSPKPSETADVNTNVANKEVNKDDLTSQLEAAGRLLGVGRLDEVLRAVSRILDEHPQHYLALCLAAKAQANAGRHEAALDFCQRASRVEPFAPLSYHLMARIEEDRGDADAAKSWLRRVIYLAPHNIWPYLEMIAWYQRDRDAARAQSARRSVAKMLAALPPETMISDSLFPTAIHSGFSLGARQLLSRIEDEIRSEKG